MGFKLFILSLAVLAVAVSICKCGREEEKILQDSVRPVSKMWTMIRMPVTNSCFLMQSTGAVPKPADLKRLLENKDGVVMARSPTEVKVKVVGTIEDRSQSE
ncbi:hypothetical protein OS493_027318 [Desmophyllum pertusum]|uniref:Uncharacterized protein n=1 Tax=Desmophyllum pertusum TaxID=174260 RepID=A0A9X0CRU7_9CNID|nr:hypothetical protein OS493_027318 [Desmophyllum pertusum]